MLHLVHARFRRNGASFPCKIRVHHIKRPRPDFDPGRGFSLLQRCADRAKGPAELGANALHGNDNSDRDSGGNQTVFDCCGPGFVFEKSQSKRLHGGSQSVFAA